MTTLLVKPEAIQALYTLTGITPGERWRQAPRLPPGYLPAIVRFMKVDADAREARAFASGTIIGSLNGRWLVITTAAHVLESNAAEPRVPGLESEEERLSRRFPIDKSINVEIALLEPYRQVICAIAMSEVSPDPRLADTALVFVMLPPEFTGMAQSMKLDLGPPPWSHFPVMTAGFTGAADGEPWVTSANGLRRHRRDLIVREGFLEKYGEGDSWLLKYQVGTIGIPLASGMSGGPTIIYRPEAVGPEPVLVAINSASPDVRPPDLPKGFVTPAICLWRQEVALPDGTWIPFAEAVGRGIIATSGPHPHHVVMRDNGDLVVDAGQRPEPDPDLPPLDPPTMPA